MKKRRVEEDDMEVEVTPKKRSKKEKQPKPAKGFFANECYEPYTGKIYSIMYFVQSCACLLCFLFLFGGGKSARLAKAYMEETGDTDGIGFLAAGKAIRGVAVGLFFLGLLFVLFYIAIVVGAASLML